MAAKKVGVLIKEARTAAGLSQESLARKIDGVSATDIGKVERGEKDLTQAQLKEIAKALGITQKSLLEAPKNLGSSTAAKKPASTTSAAKKTTSSSTAAKKTSSTSTAAKKTTSSSSTAKKTASSSGTTMKLTATEKKLVELYRAADSDTRKAAVSVLKGETPAGADILSKLLGSAVEMFGKK